MLFGWDWLWQHSATVEQLSWPAFSVSVSQAAAAEQAQNTLDSNLPVLGNFLSFELEPVACDRYPETAIRLRR